LEEVEGGTDIRAAGFKGVQEASLRIESRMVDEDNEFLTQI